MEVYRTRHINFKELITINDWKVKVYTISKTKEFNHPEYYNQMLQQLPHWLKMENSFNASHDNCAFLILHAGTEGIFSIINWWVGRNMLNTHVFVSDFESPDTFTRISGDGLAPCIWELEVINYERLSWMKHVLKQPSDPDYKTYLNDTIRLEL